MDLVYKNLAYGCLIVIEKRAESDPNTRFKTLTKTYSYFLWVFLSAYCMYKWWKFSLSHTKNPIFTFCISKSHFHIHFTQCTPKFIKRNTRCLVVYPQWWATSCFLTTFIILNFKPSFLNLDIYAHEI